VNPAESVFQKHSVSSQEKETKPIITSQVGTRFDAETDCALEMRLLTEGFLTYILQATNYNKI